MSNLDELILKSKGKLKSSSPEFAELLIAELGGVSAVAKLVGSAASSIIDWKKNGVPGGRLAYLMLVKPHLKVWQHTTVEGPNGKPA